MLSLRNTFVLLCFVANIFCFDLYVGQNGMEDRSCGLSQSTPCKTIDLAVSYHILASDSMAKLASNEKIQINIEKGNYTSSIPWAFVYSRFDFFESIPQNIIFKAIEPKSVFIDYFIELRGIDELTDKFGFVSFEGIVFHHEILIDVSAEAVEFIFRNCLFINEKNLFGRLPAIVNEARTDVELIESEFVSRGVRFARGNRLNIKSCKFTGEIEEMIEEKMMIDGNSNDSYVNPHPNKYPPLSAMVLSSAKETVIDECNFENIDAHGDVALIAWDGSVSKVDSQDIIKAPIFKISNTKFQNVDIQHETTEGVTRIGGALFVYDCIESVKESVNNTCQESLIEFSNVNIDDSHTGHSLLTIIGGRAELKNIATNNTQLESNEHAGAIMILEDAEITIENSIFQNSGPKEYAISQPNTWQLSGGFILLDSELTIASSTIEELRGWQSGVLWCENTRVVIDSETNDNLKQNTGVAVPYGESKGRATGNVFMNADDNTDRNWSCGRQCSVREDQTRDLCPKEFTFAPLSPAIQTNTANHFHSTLFSMILLLLIIVVS